MRPHPAVRGARAALRRQQGPGFAVLGFPANDFGAPGAGDRRRDRRVLPDEYAVTFPVIAKISVVGDDQHPLYAELTTRCPTADGKDGIRERLRGYGMTPTEDPDVLWNFEKFLIGKDGTVVARFAPAVGPDDPSLVAAIDAELAK